MTDQERAFSPQLQALIDDLVPICRKLAEGRGRYAISIGGSQGKGMSDARSDVDFRLFHERDLPWLDTHPELWQDYLAAEKRWKERGIIIDGIWARKIDKIDAAINRWIDGDTRPEDIFWTIWGYYLLPDIYHQAVIEDPYGVIADWKGRLQVYPPKLKQAILDKHLRSVRYWRDDYHYRNKVERGDIVFTASQSARLIHDLIQILFAVNEVYYVGDGQNLDFVRKFPIAPANFSAKVKDILYPPQTDNVLIAQYHALISLIDEVTQLIK